MLRKYCLLITIVLTIGLSIFSGIMMRDIYKTTDIEMLESKDVVTSLCFLCSLDDYNFNRSQYQSLLENPGMILKVKVLSKEKMADRIISKVEVMEDNQKSDLKGKEIRILEDYSFLNYDEYQNSCFSLTLPMYVGNEYVVNVKKSFISEDLYELKMDNFSVYEIAETINAMFVDDDIKMKLDEGQTAMLIKLGNLDDREDLKMILGVDDMNQFVAEFNEYQENRYWQLMESIEKDTD